MLITSTGQGPVAEMRISELIFNAQHETFSLAERAERQHSCCIIFVSDSKRPKLLELYTHLNSFLLMDFDKTKISSNIL